MAVLVARLAMIEKPYHRIRETCNDGYSSTMTTMKPGTPILKRKRAYGPDVRLITRNGVMLVEKTYRARTLPVRLIGRLLVAWEAFIYSKLQGIAGIPRTVESPDPYTITTTYMGGHDLRKRTRIPDHAYFEDLDRLVKAVHERGVIHLDLRNRRNYGMDEHGKPYLVDFASSVYLPRKDVVWKTLKRIDCMGLYKLKAKINPALMSEEEKRGYLKGSLLSGLWLPGRILDFLRRLSGRP